MPEYPELDIDTTLSELDRLADAARPALSGLVEGTARAVALVQFLLDEQGFRGNTDDYDDPRNSFLNEVLSRRLGILITPPLWPSRLRAGWTFRCAGCRFRVTSSCARMANSRC